MAVTLTFPTGFKFSYSGDCRPSAAFAEIGRDSTVLLHEATFDDELAGDALAKKHSTTSEALGVGVGMAARRVVLTHFSQRYAKVPIMGGLEGVGVVVEDEGERGGVEGEREWMEGVEGVEGLDAGIGDQEMGGEKVEAGIISNGAPEAQPYESSPQRRSRSPTRVASPHATVVTTPATAKDMKVAIAFDYMRVRVRDIACLERFTPALLKLYEQEDMDDKVGTMAEVEREAKVKAKANAGAKAVGKGKKGEGRSEGKGEGQNGIRNGEGKNRDGDGDAVVGQ